MNDTKFFSFIYSENKSNQKLWIEAYTSLQRNPAQASIFLTNREVSGAFIANFEDYGTRIAEFLRQIPRYTPKTTLAQQTREDLDSKQAIGGQLVKRVLLPLLENKYQHLHNRDALFEFLISSIPLSDRNCLEQLAEKLGEIPRLLGKIISDKRNSNSIQEWASLLAKNPKAMQDWIETAVDLAGNCGGDHGVSHMIERWELLKTLRPHLFNAKRQFEASQRLNSSSVTPSPRNFRILNRDEERFQKWRQSPTTSTATVDLAAEAVTLLGSFGMAVPFFGGHLDRTIDEIENKTLDVMQAIISTFPCRLCFLRGYGNASNTTFPTNETNFEQNLEELDLDTFEGLLGSNLGIWKISLSAQALKDLKKSMKEGNFDHIKGKLQVLASGEWRGKSVINPVTNLGGRFKVPVFEAWYGSNGRILWQVDIAFDEKHNSDCQIVRVWRIGDVKEMLSSFNAVSLAQQNFSSSRVVNCRKNLLDKSGKRKNPITFGQSDDSINTEYNPTTTDQRTAQDMLISGKFHTLTSTVLDSIIRNQPRSDFPFDVTGKEVEIIKHFRTATFILGRSGTGKTSCLLYKLLSRYLACNLVKRETPVRQLLLTRSEPLARKLEDEVRLLIDTQLLRVKAGLNPNDDDTPAIHARDEMDEETTEDLFCLQEHDFPLVCTFGHFLKRLENTVRAHDRKNFSVRTGIERGESSVNDMRQMVDFTVFKAAYWQQFPTYLKAGLAPDLVFAEIMGVIKGAASFSTGFNPLSREEYRSKSSRLAPTFAKEGDRDKVYNVFEHYENKKKQNRDYDGIDRVAVVLSELARNATLKRRVEELFEEVYVDEVQDQRPLEIELLLNIVQNPRGIHFAGDSAQCISKDSTFRFANIKALFYDHFSNSAFAKIDPRLAKPELFSLSRNFRSHQGILSLASFVMDLLWKGFPEMVDKLSPEIGQYLGPKPVIFVGSNIIELLQMAGKSSEKGEQNRVGSDNAEVKQTKNKQVVIIRDESIQKELEAELGDGSLVFTILQSKGMEYDDVFLFDFFSSSPCSRSFKSLQELLHAGPNLLYSVNHMEMCSELKNLYVAITRPRRRLWILESSESFVLELFTTMAPAPLVDLTRFASKDLPVLMSEVRPASATSAREWIETGEQCMERGMFDQALKCFKNAQSTRNVLWAEGSIAEQKGRESRAKGDAAGLKSYFKEAGDCFLEIGMKERAAHCLEASEDFAGAASIHSEKGRYEKAAGLFEKAGMHKEEADQYDKLANQYDKATNQSEKTEMFYKVLKVLYDGKLFEPLVHRLHEYRGKIDDGDRKIYARECNILLRQGKIAASLWDTTFDTLLEEEKEGFLKEFRYEKELLNFYLTRGRLKEAFKYSVKLGEFEEALELIMNRGSECGINLEISEDDFGLQEIFKYAQTRKLFSHISGSSTTSIDLDFDQNFSGNSWSHAWADLSTAANGYFKDGIKPCRESIKESWIKEYMDTIISMKIEYFLKLGGDLDSLPLEYLCGLTEIGKTLSENNPPLISKSVLLCLGVLPIPGETNSYAVLAWSSLPLDSKSPRTFKYEDISKKVIAYLSKQIPNARFLIEQKARKLWETTSKMLECDACMTRGKWDDPEENNRSGPKCSHNIPSESQFLRSMEGLTRLCRLLDVLEDPSLDRWLDTLLSQLRYNSSRFQDAGVITTVNQTICTLEANTNILYKLQNCFQKSWRPQDLGNTRDDFVSLLENYQLGYNLGVAHGVLKSAISNRANSMTPQNNPRKGRNQRPPPPDRVFFAFDKYQSLRPQSAGKPLQVSVGRFCENVCGLLQLLLDLRTNTKCLSFYHGSVISIYEDIVTFLLFSSRRTDVVIPKSWTKLYLPHWEPYLKTTTDLERCCYQQTLLRVVASFCDLISSIEGSSQGKLGDRELLARRSVDLLVVSLVNIGTIGPLPLGYDNLWEKIQTVFGRKALGTKGIQGIPANTLVRTLSLAFQFYNRKDSILVYVREGRLSKRIESWSGSGIQPALLPIRQNAAVGPQNREEKKCNAAFIIQAWYRKRRAKFAQHQKHMESASGNSVAFLQSLCSAHRTKKPSRQVFWEFAAVMFTEGLELYLLLETIYAKFRAIRELAAKLNVVEKHAVELRDYEKQLSSKAGFLFQMTDPNAFDLEKTEFQVKCKEGLESANSLGDRMSAIMQTLQEPPKAPPKAVGGKKGKRKGKKKRLEVPVDPKGLKSGPESKDGSKGVQKSVPNNPSKDTPKDGSKNEPKSDQEAGPKKEQKDTTEDGLTDEPKDKAEDIKVGGKDGEGEEPSEDGSTKDKIEEIKSKGEDGGKKAQGDESKKDKVEEIKGEGEDGEKVEAPGDALTEDKVEEIKIEGEAGEKKEAPGDTSTKDKVEEINEGEYAEIKEAQGNETEGNEEKPQTPSGQLTERQKEKSRELEVGSNEGGSNEPIVDVDNSDDEFANMRPPGLWYDEPTVELGEAGKNSGNDEHNGAEGQSNEVKWGKKFWKWGKEKGNGKQKKP